MLQYKHINVIRCFTTWQTKIFGPVHCCKEDEVASQKCKRLSFRLTFKGSHFLTKEVYTDRTIWTNLSYIRCKETINAHKNFRSLTRFFLTYRILQSIESCFLVPTYLWFDAVRQRWLVFWKVKHKQFMC